MDTARSAARRKRGGAARFAVALGVALATATSFASTGCALFGNDEVARKVHGRTIRGHFVAPNAYGHFVQGSVLEARGDLEGARRAYQIAVAEAPEEPEPLIRLGAVECRLGTDPTNTFERARQRDPELASLWAERAACFLLADKPDRAVADATRAMELGPSDPTNSLLLGRALRAAHRDEDAAKMLRAAVARWPDDVRIVEWERAAREGGSGPGADPPTFPRRLTPPRRGDTTALEEALRRGDDDGAAKAAATTHVPLTDLALRAAAFGRVALADRTARLVLAADPASADARIALLVAADLGREDAAFAVGLAPFPGPATPPSPLALALLDETLRRRLPLDELTSFAPSPPSDDPVVAMVVARATRAPRPQ